METLLRTNSFTNNTPVTVEDLELAIDLAGLSENEDASMDIHENIQGNIASLINKCIKNGTQIENPLLRELIDLNVEEVEMTLPGEFIDPYDMQPDQKSLNVYEAVNNIGDLQDIIKDLPRDLPLVSKGTVCNHQGLVFLSDENLFSRSKNDGIEYNFAARFVGISKSEMKTMDIFNAN